MTAAAHFPFVQRATDLGTASLAPLLPITLASARTVSVMGLLDTDAAVNVLPFSVGEQLGADWDALSTTVELSGNLSTVEARVLVASAVVASFPPVRLAFAWAKTDAVSVLLGQVNFFLEFDVCFFRSVSLFEVRPKQARRPASKRSKRTNPS